ncbi:enolase C-terminal domain-like protein [Goodfellowiella coeruleoviolacea]|uniref:Mandelate racemase / muconate lactonizing enzyme, N-terminal domain n=1 Tax=Goodfellowiella coeruleoviolacea TaxID=334858 RepID=A0AAE3KHR9_9PSEU|nr:enolase C-terminal domain-like protein [Goodfellowiella coeruleoviolacea]MCP2167675.1 Mandelate racemase / muconate lactonizing enzyme, N-terminal domain [Goodfellowiella coeruleoviolacea]
MIESVGASAYRVPTPVPEADGTLAWDATTIVVVTARADGRTGLGWTYTDASCADLVNGMLAGVVVGTNQLDVRSGWHAMQRAVRNVGRPGLAASALSAVDIALWDLAARSVELPLATLLGRVRDRAEVFVDANGAYSVGQAVRVGQRLAEWDVTWFEEPVSSDDLPGLAHVRARTSPDVAAGEYGYDLPYFARMVGAAAVDCVQVDVTRCGGYTEWARIAAVAAAHNRDVSAHCAPNLSAHIAVATPNFRHIEWFADHDRIESEFFTGVLDPGGGTVAPGEAPGHGMSLRHDTADRHRLR